MCLASIRLPIAQIMKDISKPRFFLIWMQKTEARGKGGYRGKDLAFKYRVSAKLMLPIQCAVEQVKFQFFTRIQWPKKLWVGFLNYSSHSHPPLSHVHSWYCNWLCCLCQNYSELSIKIKTPLTCPSNIKGLGWSVEKPVDFLMFRLIPKECGSAGREPL